MQHREVGNIFRKGLIGIWCALLLPTIGIADPTIAVKEPIPLGKVKSIKTYDTEDTLRELSIYDEHKRLLEYASFYENGSLAEKDRYRYYNNGVKKEHRNWLGEESLRVFIYRRDSKLGEITFPKRDLDLGLSVARTIFRYNEGDRVIEKVSHTANGSEWERADYEYKGDKLHREISRRASGRTSTKSYAYFPSGDVKRIAFETNALLSAVWSYEYDEQGNKVAWIEKRFHKGQPGSTTTHRFDKNGNKTERDSGSRKRIYRYDSVGNLKKEEAYGKDGRLAYQYDYSYDDKGNLTERQEHFGEQLKGALNYRSKFEYIYDETGNWAKRKELYWNHDEKKFFESEPWYRDIEYW